MSTRAADKPTAEDRKGADRVESAINKDKSSPSPFLKELDSITGPAQSKAIQQLDKDGYGARATAMEAQKLLTDNNPVVNGVFGKGSITRDQVQAAANDQTKSPAERALAARVDKAWTDLSGNGKEITQKDVERYRDKEQTHADMANAHAKDKDGKTLLDRVGDGKGGVSGDKLEKEMSNPNLTDKDKASLERLNAARDSGYVYGKSGDLTKDQVAKLDQQAGLSPEEIKGKAKTGDPTSAEGQAAAAALKDLTAKPGGGQSLLDKVGDGKGGVDEKKVQELLDNKDKHNLTPENQKTLQYLNDQINKNALPDYSGSGAGPTRMDLSKDDLAKAGRDAGVDLKPHNEAASPEQKDREARFSHLFDKGKDGKSLYDSVKNPDGSVSASKVEDALKNNNIKPQDAASLQYLKNLSDDKFFGGKKDLSKEELAREAKEHNFSPEKVKNAGLDTPPPAARPADGQKEVQGPPMPPEMKPEARAALTPPRSGGYYHVAEQMLTAAHKGDKNYEPSQKELKELVHQLQHANHNRKSLSQKEPLVVDEAIRKNPALAKLFA